MARPLNNDGGEDGVTLGKWRRCLAWGAAASMFAAACAGAVAWLYLTAPTGAAGTEPVDALLVLGAPALDDGSVSPVQAWRVDEAMREFRAGRAPHVLFTGGHTNGGYTESQVMGAEALRQGMPPEAIFEETRSRTTLENLDNSIPLLKQHGWWRVEVISTPPHLHRAGALLKNSGLEWRLHASPTPGLLASDRRRMVVEEAMGTAALRVFGPRTEPLLHGSFSLVSRTIQRIEWIALKLHG